MTTKALTTVLVVQPVSTASLTSIPYGLILADANRFIRRDGNAVVHVVQPVTLLKTAIRSAFSSEKT
jgi:hypothetical protein